MKDDEVEEVARIRRRREKRNDSRLALANDIDKATLGEFELTTTQTSAGKEGRSAGQTAMKNAQEAYLTGSARDFFAEPIRGPDDTFQPPAWFLQELVKLSKTETKTPLKSPIVFETTKEARETNAAILASTGFCVKTLIENHSETTLGYGSEFRTVDQLRPLVGRHPNFGSLSLVLTNGMPYVFLTELDQATKSDELKTLVLRGNHKSAKDFPTEVGELLRKDVLHGFSIPLPIETVYQIPGAAVQPLGIAQQRTTDDEGNRKAKFRLTQDLSFASKKWTVPVSINSRIDMEAYPEMIYGWCLPRILHYVVALRLAHPGIRILICKYDYSDAYRRVAHSATAAVQTFAIHEETAFLALRLTFGGSPNPPAFCSFSELVTDLSNEISQCSNWEPSETHSPAQPRTPEPKRIEDGTPIAPGKRMAVQIPIPKSGPIGRVDGFIDDLINVFLDNDLNCRIQPHVVPLAMHVTSRPHAGDAQEPITRRPILSIPKLNAEGSPAEVQIVLGWKLNTRELTVSLPDDKFRAWTEDISRLEAEGTCQFQDLEQLVGRLNHASFVVPITRHFLGRLRAPLDARGSRHNRIRLGTEVRSDLTLWKGILERANNGISMNLIVTREPDRVCWSDACPFGIGGYSLSGRAWRIQIPHSSPIRGHPGVNNLLEFIGMAVNIWLECRDTEASQACILAIGDNTSAIGWLFKTSKLDSNSPAHEAHLFVARHVANLLLDHECCIASQHIRGELNIVADLLSFAGTDDRGKGHPLAHDHPPNDVLTRRFHAHFVSQIPAAFVISQLPKDILCWVTQALLIMESY